MANSNPAVVVAKSVYLILGLVFTSYGAYYLISPNSLLPDAILDLTADSGMLDLVSQEMAHLAQELGASFLAWGLIMFWCIFNRDKATWINYILLLFFACISGIHWMEYLAGNRELISPLFNSIPLFLFIVVILTNSNRPNSA